MCPNNPKAEGLPSLSPNVKGLPERNEQRVPAGAHNAMTGPQTFPTRPSLHPGKGLSPPAIRRCSQPFQEGARGRASSSGSEKEGSLNPISTQTESGAGKPTHGQGPALQGGAQAPSPAPTAPLSPLHSPAEQPPCPPGRERSSPQDGLPAGKAGAPLSEEEKSSHQPPELLSTDSREGYLFFLEEQETQVGLSLSGGGRGH